MQRRSDEDNHGLPFFLGKVLSVYNKNEEDCDEDNDESDEAPEHLVEIHEYIQTENNDGEPSGKYQLRMHNVDGERKKGVESHNSQGGHFESPNRPNCVGDREDEWQ